MAVETTSAALPAIDQGALPATALDQKPAKRGFRRLMAVAQIRSVLACYIALLRAGSWFGLARRPIPSQGPIS